MIQLLNTGQRAERLVPALQNMIWSNTLDSLLKLLEGKLFHSCPAEESVLLRVSFKLYALSILFILAIAIIMLYCMNQSYMVIKTWISVHN